MLSLASLLFKWNDCVIKWNIQRCVIWIDVIELENKSVRYLSMTIWQYL